LSDNGTILKSAKGVVAKIINRLYGFRLFAVRNDSVPLDQVNYYYQRVFSLDKDDVFVVLEDLARYTGFLKCNRDNNPVEEGKRQVFIYIVSKISKERMQVNAESERKKGKMIIGGVNIG